MKTVLVLHGWTWGLAGGGLLALAVWTLLRPWRNATAVVRFSNLETVREASRGQRAWAEPVLKGLRALVLVLLVLALLRPRSGRAVEEIISPGVDIVVAMDLSGSMLAEDMGGRSRIDVAKEVVIQFVRGRTHDRIGLVVFAGKAFTQCPPTMDYGLLERLVSQIEAGAIKADGTAIGLGLATALNRLKEAAAKSRIVVLVTDGRNNTGSIDPPTAAEMARALGIRVYTVGVGGRGPARMPVRDVFGRKGYTVIQDDLDEESLTQIARATGAIFRRAADPDGLAEVLKEISDLEKTPVKVREHHLYRELFLYLVVPALILLVLELALASTVFLRVP
jgi:Ca-activated chloride channel family protein